MVKLDGLKNNLSLEINRELDKLEVNSFSPPIKIGNNYLILKINEIKKIPVKIDKQKELDKMIMIETSKQLDKFSSIFYNKIKLNSNISEFSPILIVPGKEKVFFSRFF